MGSFGIGRSSVNSASQSVPYIERDGSDLPPGGSVAYVFRYRSASTSSENADEAWRRLA